MALIRFSPITAESLQLIGRFASLCDNRVSDYSLANLFGWQPRFNTQYAIVDDHLVVRFLSEGGTWYMRPLPSVKGDCEHTLKVIERLRHEAFLCGSDFILYGLRQDEALALKNLCSKDMTIQPLRNNAGYLYRREQLATLAGRKLQAKRNHVNRFRALYPAFEYRAIDSAMTPQCLDFAMQWARHHVELFPEQTDSAAAELTAIRRCLSHWDELPLIGGSLWVDGRMVAFTYGCPVSDDTLDVCVEKADIAYEGAYTVINQLFAQHVPEQYVYLNREEDLGVEGLRKAKLSYHPEEILERCLCKEPIPTAFHEREEVRALWQTTFSDTESFADLYFARIFTHERNLAGLDNGQLIAALQLLPYQLKWHHQQLPARYVSGVMVRENYRYQGIGSELMRQAHVKAFRERAAIACLLAATDDLGIWYSRMGYTSIAQCPPPTKGIEHLTFQDYDKWQQAQETILLHNANDLELVQLNMSTDGFPTDTTVYPGWVRILDVGQVLGCYARLHPELSQTFIVHDDNHLPANNGVYRLEGGIVNHLIDDTPEARRISLAELTRYLFSGSPIIMTLMLER